MSEDKRFLTAEEILAAAAIETRVVYVPEWDGAVRLRTLTGETGIEFVAAVKANPGSAFRIVAFAAVKEDGSRLFTVEEVEQLKRKSLRAIMRLQTVALEMNGLTVETQAAAKNG